MELENLALSNNGWTPVYDAADEIEASLVALVLEDAGFSTRVPRNNLRLFYPINTWDAGLVQVMVPAANAVKARKALLSLSAAPEYKMQTLGWTVIHGGKHNDTD